MQSKDFRHDPWLRSCDTTLFILHPTKIEDLKSIWPDAVHSAIRRVPPVHCPRSLYSCVYPQSASEFGWHQSEMLPRRLTRAFTTTSRRLAAPPESLVKSFLYGSEKGQELQREMEQSYSKVLARGKYVHKLNQHFVKPDKIDEYTALMYPPMCSLIQCWDFSEDCEWSWEWSSFGWFVEDDRWSLGLVYAHLGVPWVSRIRQDDSQTGDTRLLSKISQGGRKVSCISSEWYHAGVCFLEYRSTEGVGGCIRIENVYVETWQIIRVGRTMAERIGSEEEVYGTDWCLVYPDWQFKSSVSYLAVSGSLHSLIALIYRPSVSQGESWTMLEYVLSKIWLM